MNLSCTAMAHYTHYQFFKALGWIRLSITFRFGLAEDAAAAADLALAAAVAGPAERAPPS